MSDEQSDKESEFMAWFTAENRRRELDRLEKQRARYEWLIIICGLFTAAWGTGLYFGYRLGYIPPDIAAVTSAVVMGGGFYMIWRLHRMRTTVRKQLKAEKQKPT
jgi:hypothetical protein